MTAAYVRITPDVVFAADVFPRVDFVQSEPRSRKRASDPDEPAIDPRQIDLWGHNTEHTQAPGS
jgi:hypothetical protein